MFCTNIRSHTEESQEKRATHHCETLKPTLNQYNGVQSGMSQAACSKLNIRVVSGVPHCVSGSLWFGFFSELPQISTKCLISWSCPKSCCLWPLASRYSGHALSRGLTVPHCSRSVIELKIWLTGGDSGQSLATEPSCGEESGWVLDGCLGGIKLEAGCAEPWIQHSHPTQRGLA